MTEIGAGFRWVDAREIYRGRILAVEVGEFLSPHGESFERDIVRTPGAVVVAPVLEHRSAEPQIILIRQYRPSVDDVLWELPAGVRDVPGEPPDETARRELIEEVGFDAGSIVPTGSFLASPGMTDARHLHFMATDLNNVGRHAHGPEEEAMIIEHVALRRAREMVFAGEIFNGPAAMGILLACEQLGFRP